MSYPLYVTLCTEHEEGEDPEHLCRVGISYKHHRLMADCFATDEKFILNNAVDRKIAALETALEKVIRQVFDLALVDH